jgi:ABC-type lipoprotein export system ATPase subunit
MTVLLELEQATRVYRFPDNDVVALDSVDLAIHRGGVTVLLGPSGSGKTTLLHVLAGFERLDAGALRWHARVGDPPTWAEVAVLPQRLGLLHELNVADNITWPVRLSTTKNGLAHTRFQEITEDLGLVPLLERDPSETSLGEQQRTALARALLLSPAVLLADEPTGHQDAAMTDRVVASLVRAADEGTTVIVATHDTRVTERADSVVRLHAGRIDPV